MKKLFTFCFFAFAMLIGTQSATAQSKQEINDKAAKSTKELRSLLKMDEVAVEKVYNAYKNYEIKMASLDIHTELNTQSDADRMVVKERFNKAMEAALGQELYKRFEIIAEKQSEDAKVAAKRK